MIPVETEDRRTSLKAKVLERLHDPVQLRVCVVSAVLLVGYGAIYMPLSKRIDETTRKLDREKKLYELAGSMKRLQEQYRSFHDRLPPQVDTKEWVHYVLEGVRSFPLKLNKLDCREPEKVGPYLAVVLQIEMEGSFFDIDKFLRWLETNRRMFRADDVRIGLSQTSNDVMVIRLTVLGIMG
jgi:Tfp pilus assembly protein PilO